MSKNKAAPKTLKKVASRAAYTLVDLSGLEKETREDIVEDAQMGGGRYGVRIVEEAINGAARAPIFGVYNDGPDAELWADAKKELGLGSTTVDDSTVVPVGVELQDERQEAALREAAAQIVEEQADRIRAGEEAEIEAIVGPTDASNVSETVATPAKRATNKSPR